MSRRGPMWALLIAALVLLATAASVSASADYEYDATLSSGDLIEARTLASLEFRDPGSAASLLEHTRANVRAGVEEAVEDVDTLSLDDVASRYLAHRGAHEDIHAAHERESAEDARLEALLESGGDLASALSTSTSASTSNTAGSHSFLSVDGHAQARGSTAVLPAGVKLRTVEKITPLSALGRPATVLEKLDNARKDLESLHNSPEYAVMDKVLNKVTNMAHASDRLRQDITTQNVYVPVVDPLDKETKQKRREARYADGLKAPQPRDIIDCTACRFAWLQVEVDLGESHHAVELYDSFVTHCAAMQLSRIFAPACTTMFANVDALIGDYIAGNSVNQLCMNAGMCR